MDAPLRTVTRPADTGKGRPRREWHNRPRFRRSSEVTALGLGLANRLYLIRRKFDNRPLYRMPGRSHPRGEDVCAHVLSRGDDGSQVPAMLMSRLSSVDPCR